MENDTVACQWMKGCNRPGNHLWITGYDQVTQEYLCERHYATWVQRHRLRYVLWLISPRRHAHNLRVLLRMIMRNARARRGFDRP